MAAREKYAGVQQKKTAQWFFNPVLSESYGLIAQNLMQYKETVREPKLLKKNY